MSSLDALADMDEDEGNEATINVTAPQDLHTMLEVIWDEFIKIQETGFVWDLMYKGKEYQGIEFQLFTPFIKCDTDEADRLAGSYTSRTKQISQLCRYCCCPTDECDEPHANYPRKTVPMIDKLIKKDDDVRLAQLSQQKINNACYKLRFGVHNTEGVHGACPLEMLHALLLGIFKYVRDCFYEQVGPTSRRAKEINALADAYGHLFSHQSDRDMPKTKFSNGIQAGKIMAKEFSGVLLLLATILQSTKGKNILAGKKTAPFAKNGLLDKWRMLIETLLMWEMWLKSDTMTKKHVRRSQKKHLYIMYLIRLIADRKKGMGLKIVKYHAIMHMTQDIIHFGVPMNYDTGADESGHKSSKTAAKLTQRRRDTFDAQVCQRLNEVHVLDLAMEEIVSDRPLYYYYADEEEIGTESRKSPVRRQSLDEPDIGGRRIVVCFSERRTTPA